MDAPHCPPRVQKQMDEAAVQLAAANNRYQDALVQLHSERSKTAALEVRLVGAVSNCCLPPGWRIPGMPIGRPL